MDIMGGLRPSMPDCAPEEYKKLAKRCCDADTDKRLDAYILWNDNLRGRKKTILLVKSGMPFIIIT